MPSPLTVVLLPGMDGTGAMFAPLIKALNCVYSISVVTYPCDIALGYAELTEIAWEALPKNMPFVLLGESFSGPIAIELAAREPVNLVGLILCATFSANPRPELGFSRSLLNYLPVKQAPFFIANYFLMGRFSTATLRQLLAQSLSQVAAVVLRARMAAVLNVDVTDRLAKVCVPVLYLRAKYDRLVPRSASTHLLAHCKSAVELEFDAPHFLLQTEAAAATDCIHEFCAKFITSIKSKIILI